jgi:hypothetical protein
MIAYTGIRWGICFSNNATISRELIYGVKQTACIGVERIQLNKKHRIFVNATHDLPLIGSG